MISRFDQLDRAGKGREAWRYLDSLVVTAEASGDRALHMQALLKRGGTRSYRGEIDRGEADLLAADRLAVAMQDTLGVLEATRWRALALSDRGRIEPAARLWARMRDWARAWGSPSHEGWARLGLALADLQRGRAEASRVGYRRARELFAAAGDAPGLRQAGVGLQRVLMQQRRYGEMRELTLQQVREARTAGDHLTEAQLLNNLAALEWWLGDPRRSLDLMRQAIVSYQVDEKLRGRPIQAVTYTNLANALSRLGRDEEAAAMLERASAQWRTRDLDSFGEIENMLAQVRVLQGRAGEAERRMRALMTRRDSLSPKTASSATAMLMLALARQGRDDEALVLALRYRPSLDRNAGAARGDLRAEIVRAFIRAGRAAEAMDLIDEVNPSDRWEQPARWDHSSSLLRTSALAEMGRLSDAAARLPLLTRQLLVLRGASRDYASRESFGDETAALTRLSARVWSDPALTMPPEVRAERLFDALQPLKAISLDERLRAPAQHDTSTTSNPVTLVKLRTSVLREGELLLDLHECGPHTILIAASKRSVRMVELGPWGTLGPRLDRLSELLSGPDRAAAEEAATTMGRALLGDVAELVSASPVILFSPGSQPVALAALRLPGAREPLGATHVVALVPSATVLARLRALPSRAGSPLVALAGGEDARGRRLSGARAEVRWLGSQFEGVRTPEITDGRSAMRVLRTAGVAHLAGHSEVDEDNPWGSRFLLGDAGRPEAWLEASQVAGTRLASRLAVLSGCRSIGAARRGEGVLGLASAFMSAGVPSTLATLWDVEDQKTADAMRSFYRALSSGLSAGEALQRAQTELRARPGTASPRDWAAFTLVGLPETRVTLRRTLASRVLR